MYRMIAKVYTQEGLMSTKRTTICIVDMTCSSCEARVTKTLMALEGVVSRVAVQISNMMTARRRFKL
jgi:hypothetical protein